MYGGLTKSDDLLATNFVTVWIVASVRIRVKPFQSNGNNPVGIDIRPVAGASLQIKVGSAML